MREHRRPAVLHLRTVRYLGHAGADVEAAYRSPQDVRADLERDPLLATAAWLVATGARTGSRLADEYLETRARVREVALEAARRPQLGTRGRRDAAARAALAERRGGARRETQPPAGSL